MIYKFHAMEGGTRLGRSRDQAVQFRFACCSCSHCIHCLRTRNPLFPLFNYISLRPFSTSSNARRGHISGSAHPSDKNDHTLSTMSRRYDARTTIFSPEGKTIVSLGRILVGRPSLLVIPTPLTSYIGTPEHEDQHTSYLDMN